MHRRVGTPGKIHVRYLHVWLICIGWCCSSDGHRNSVSWTYPFVHVFSRCVWWPPTSVYRLQVTGICTKTTRGKASSSSRCLTLHHSISNYSANLPYECTPVCAPLRESNWMRIDLNENPCENCHSHDVTHENWIDLCAPVRREGSARHLYYTMIYYDCYNISSLLVVSKSYIPSRWCQRHCKAGWSLKSLFSLNTGGTRIQNIHII